MQKGKIKTGTIIGALFAIGVVGFVAGAISIPEISEEEIVARGGVHWHAELHIRINGEAVTIPANIGLGASGGHPQHMHTHDSDNVIHAERQGLVLRDDLRLKRFFEIWEKSFSKDSILGNAATASESIEMLVNGAPNEDYEDYVLQDGDRIEIIYGMVKGSEEAGEVSSTTDLMLFDSEEPHISL